jgi:hypothetical protein
VSASLSMPPSSFTATSDDFSHPAAWRASQAFASEGWGTLVTVREHRP